jgi:hypothetical protein
MTETWMWQKVKRGLEPLMVHCCRVENTAGSGIPDVNCCHQGVEFWLELKIVRENRIQFRSSQIAWITERSGYSGRVFILAKRGEWLLVYKGTQAYSLGVSNGYVDDVTPAKIFKGPWNWKEILSFLVTSNVETNVPFLNQKI